MADRNNAESPIFKKRFARRKTTQRAFTFARNFGSAAAENQVVEQVGDRGVVITSPVKLPGDTSGLSISEIVRNSPVPVLIAHSSSKKSQKKARSRTPDDDEDSLDTSQRRRSIRSREPSHAFLNRQQYPHGTPQQLKNYTPDEHYIGSQNSSNIDEEISVIDENEFSLGGRKRKTGNTSSSSAKTSARAGSANKSKSLQAESDSDTPFKTPDKVRSANQSSILHTSASSNRADQRQSQDISTGKVPGKKTTSAPPSLEKSARGRQNLSRSKLGSQRKGREPSGRDETLSELAENSPASEPGNRRRAKGAATAGKKSTGPRRKANKTAASERSSDQSGSDASSRSSPRSRTQRTSTPTKSLDDESATRMASRSEIRSQKRNTDVGKSHNDKSAIPTASRSEIRSQKRNTDVEKSLDDESAIPTTSRREIRSQKRNTDVRRGFDGGDAVQSRASSGRKRKAELSMSSLPVVPEDGDALSQSSGPSSRRKGKNSSRQKREQTPEEKQPRKSGQALATSVSESTKKTTRKPMQTRNGIESSSTVPKKRTTGATLSQAPSTPVKLQSELRKANACESPKRFFSDPDRSPAKLVTTKIVGVRNSPKKGSSNSFWKTSRRANDNRTEKRKLEKALSTKTVSTVYDDENFGVDRESVDSEISHRKGRSRDRFQDFRSTESEGEKPRKRRTIELDIVAGLLDDIETQIMEDSDFTRVCQSNLRKVFSFTRRQLQETVSQVMDIKELTSQVNQLKRQCRALSDESKDNHQQNCMLQRDLKSLEDQGIDSDMVLIDKWMQSFQNFRISSALDSDQSF